MPAPDHVVDGRKSKHTSVHHHTPIHCFRVYRARQREKGKDEDGKQESQRGDIDCHAETAEGPSSRWQGLAPDTLQEHAAY
jgi:hypothetical protein